MEPTCLSSRPRPVLRLCLDYTGVLSSSLYLKWTPHRGCSWTFTAPVNRSSAFAHPCYSLQLEYSLTSIQSQFHRSFQLRSEFLCAVFLADILCYFMFLFIFSWITLVVPIRPMLANLQNNHNSFSFASMLPVCHVTSLGHFYLQEAECVSSFFWVWV